MTMDAKNLIYMTGRTPEGTCLMGGVWKLWEQEGFPLEMSHVVCCAEGTAVDWLEAMADASCTDNCPALMLHLAAFLPAETITEIQIGFMRLVASGQSYQEILESKKANGRALLA